MIRTLLRHLLVDFLILIALLTASAILPFASFWLVRDSVGGQLFFWLSPWTCAVWTVLVSVTVPARWSHTLSSYSPRSAFFRLSQAPVRGKNA